MATSRDTTQPRKILIPAHSSEASYEADALTSANQIPPKSIITLGEVAHFTVPDSMTSASLATTLARDLATTLNISDENVYGLARDHSLNGLEANFVEHFLLPKASQAGENGKLDKVDLETAMDNLRINLVTHSFGERLARNIGDELVKELQNPDKFNVPYSQQEAEKIAKQILVVGLGAALDYSGDFTPEGEMAYEPPKSYLSHIGIYGESEESVRATAQAWPQSYIMPVGSHQQEGYLESIQVQPKLQKALHDVMYADRLPDDVSHALDQVLVHSDALTQNPQLHPKLATLANLTGISIKDDKISYSIDGGEPKEIMTIIQKGRKFSIDSTYEQRANLAKAMDYSDELRHMAYDNLNRSFTPRVTIMARHQLEAKMKKDTLTTPVGRPNYQFEDRIRKDMDDKIANKNLVVETKFSGLDNMVYEATEPLPRHIPEGLEPVDPHSHDDKVELRNRSTLNRHMKDAKKIFEEAMPSSINIGDTITIGGLDHFQGLSDDKRLGDSMKFPAELSNMLGIDHTKVKAILMSGDLKKRLGSYDDDALAEHFVKTKLVPRVSANVDGGNVPLSLEEAKANMRINFATHSFGGKLASKIMLAFEKQITDPNIINPPFSNEDAIKIASQVFQFDLGPALDYNFLSETGDTRTAFQPASSRVQAYLRRDPDLEYVHIKVNLGSDDIKGNHIYLLETPPNAGSFQSWGTNYNFNASELHTRALYMESIRQNPQLVETLRETITSKEIDTDAVTKAFEASMRKLDVTRPLEVPRLDNTKGTPLVEQSKERAVGT